MTFKILSPIDGRVYVERSFATDHEIRQTLNRAQSAQQLWKTVPLKERRDICLRFVDWMESHSAHLAEEITRQMGRPIRYAPGEIRGLAERSRFMIEAADESLADIQPGPKPNFSRFIRREPLGVILTLAPWNYPYLTSVNSVIPAIMAGNAVILKHATQTPLCAERYADAFEAAGLPKDVFQFLHMTHDAVARLIQSDGIDYVAFTGSVEGGIAVQQAARNRFIATGLELGGKDPAYVCADAPFEETVLNLVDGVFFNSGQSCCGIERIYVEASIYKDFVDAFVGETLKYVLGNPLDEATTLGPMVKTGAADFVRVQVQQALAAGARNLIDASLFPADRQGTPYLAPQVLVDVDHDMDFMTEETFGPTVGIMPVQSDEEALALMNDSRFGLTASIWTEDEERALRLGERIETGTVFMNRCDYLDPALAWVGVKDSGRGCTLSTVGYEHLTRPKSFHFRTKF